MSCKKCCCLFCRIVFYEKTFIPKTIIIYVTKVPRIGYYNMFCIPLRKLCNAGTFFIILCSKHIELRFL